MKNIRLVALDLDGTLLDSEKHLSERNRKALAACIQRGIYVVPCTGRIWKGVPDFIRLFPGIRYAITVNGAVVEDVVKHRVLDERKIHWENALEILELARNFQTMYDAYVGGQGIGEFYFMNHMDDYGSSPQLQQMIRDTRIAVADVKEEVRRQKKPVDKINYFFKDLSERQRAREALALRDDIVVSSSFPDNLEINGPGATKGDALCRLASFLGIDYEQTMGFGDGENDFTLIQKAGIGVAMGNAIEDLKIKADYVTRTNDEDGVAAAIEKLMGIEV